MTALDFVPRWWRRGRQSDTGHSQHFPAGYETDMDDHGCMWCDSFEPHDRRRATSREIWGLCSLHQVHVPEHGFCPQWKDSLSQPPEVTE